MDTDAPMILDLLRETGAAIGVPAPHDVTRDETKVGAL
jgi:hypothetical protein